MHLLQKYGDAVIARGVVDIDNREKPFPEASDAEYAWNRPVKLDFASARRLIGVDIPDDRMVEILESLRLKTLERDEKSAVFAIPSWRYDMEMEADLVEEIGRLYGLDNIPDTMPSAPSVSALDDSPFKAKARIRELCVALGFTEAMHYSFLSAKELDDFDSREAVTGARLAIPDPVSAEYGVMRDSLLPQMMGSLGRNASRQVADAKLFEIGKVFAAGPSESERISLGFTGPVGREALRRRAQVTEEEAVLWMKGAVETLLSRLHAGKVEFIAAEHPAFAKGAALEVKLNGRVIGIMGALSAKLRHPYRLTTQMVLCEMELKPLCKRVNAVGRVSAVAQFPAVTRDIALVAERSVTNETIVGVIRKNGGKELTKVELFDIFKSKELKDGRRSLAYALEFRSAEKTLTDVEVGKSFQRIVEALKATAGIEVRES
jgi:phenylalanyl-tRNA synthetase beta chain